VIPKITHLQLLILVVLSKGEMSGFQLRNRLKELNIKSDGPKFYQMMKRLEVDLFISNSKKVYTVNEQIYHQNIYCITASGKNHMKIGLDFCNMIQKL